MKQKINMVEKVYSGDDSLKSVEVLKSEELSKLINTNSAEAECDGIPLNGLYL